MEEIYRSQFRFPYRLYEQLKAAAEANHRSLNAEITARLEETFAIEEALGSVAPGASVAGTAGLLLDMHDQLSDREAEARDNATALHAEAIEQHIAETHRSIAEMSEQLRLALARLDRER